MKILFALAHPDDEAFGPCGTIRKLVMGGHDVTIASMCDGSRPGAEHVRMERQHAFRESCKILGVHGIIGAAPDLTMGYTEVVNYATDLIHRVCPDIVYTNNISDINADHRMLAEACMIASRPKPGSGVRELYFCEVPGSTDWTFHQMLPAFEPSVFVDVGEVVEYKEHCISLYSTEHYTFPDARSTESAVVLAKRRGSCVGVEYAEAFKLVFSRR
jgi:LmbE family N-acetylglucosaminyl deacetylase